jgi:hypothetical protein
MQEIFKDTLFVKDVKNSCYVHIEKKEIIFGESSGNYVNFITDSDEMYTYECTFEQFLCQMSSVSRFRKVYKTYAIRIDYISHTYIKTNAVRLRRKYMQMIEKYCSQISKYRHIPVTRDHAGVLRAIAKRRYEQQLQMKL